MVQPDIPGDVDPTLMPTDGSGLDVESATVLAEDTQPGRHTVDRMPRGAAIGRYVVLDELGAGGMGVVYAAYDPELDRKIAIKVLLSKRLAGADTSAGRARLIREAQALARLAHPNVVNVHDVGETAGDVFVAMEHIDGGTLKRWLTAEPRSVGDIVQMLLGAARGLAAAHAAGLVHRDFKPDNVLVGADGRARVVDFGLARGQPGVVSDSDDDSISGGIGLSASASQLDNDLTAVGAVMGTPAYMAPEQHVGGKVDAATDQFAFCVTLYKALYGERPFEGSSIRALSRSVCRGKVRPAPSGSSVPGWLRRIVLRGLATLPEERHASMNALIAELSRDPSVRRRQGVAAVGAVVLVGVVGGVAYASGASDGTKPCLAAADAMDELWTRARRAELKDAFSSVEVSYGADAHTRVDAALQVYASQWSAAATQACEATLVDQTQSHALMDRRVACLDTRRAAMDALLDVFGQADASVIERGVSAVRGLPDIEGCADLDALSRGVAPPESAQMREQVDALMVDVERVAVVHAAGRYKQALPEAVALVQRAETIGYQPALARALHELAGTQGELGMVEAVATTRRAFTVALAAGDNLVASRTAIDLAHDYGLTQQKMAEGLLWADVAESLGSRGSDESPIALGLLNVRSVIAQREGRNDEAQLGFESMLEQIVEADPKDPNVAVALMNLGAFHAMRNEVDLGRDYLTRAVDHITETQGPQHPSMLGLKANLGALAVYSTDFETGRDLLNDVVQMQREALGARHLDVARTLAALAIAERHLGEYERAELLSVEALDQRREFTGPDHPEIAESLRNLSMVKADQGHFEEARGLAEDALAMDARVLPAGHKHIGIDTLELARHLIALKRYDEALPRLEAAREIFAAADGDRRRLVETLIETGIVQRETGDPKTGATLERALELSELSDQRASKARALIEVAWSLRLDGAEPARAQALAERAQTIVAARPDERATAARIAAFLAD